MKERSNIIILGSKQKAKEVDLMAKNIKPKIIVVLFMFDVEQTPDDTDTNQFRFASGYFNKESGNYYNQARYYAPYMGRFTQEDTNWNVGNNIYGYNLFIVGCADDVDRSFVVAISEKQQQSGRYAIGDVIKGTAWAKLYPEREFADYYRAGALKLISCLEAAALTAGVNIAVNYTTNKKTYNDAQFQAAG